MIDMPYFHFSRKALVDIYPTEYETLKVKYRNEIECWKREWNIFLKEKYVRDMHA